jgi:hypothetical protein
MRKEEVLAHMELKKQERKMQHLKLIGIHGETRGLNEKEWNNMVVKVKGSGSKGKGFANNRLWDHRNVNLQTQYE